MGYPAQAFPKKQQIPGPQLAKGGIDVQRFPHVIHLAGIPGELQMVKPKYGLDQPGTIKRLGGGAAPKVGDPQKASRGF